MLDALKTHEGLGEQFADWHAKTEETLYQKLAELANITYGEGARKLQNESKREFWMEQREALA